MSLWNNLKSTVKTMAKINPISIYQQATKPQTQNSVLSTVPQHAPQVPGYVPPASGLSFSSANQNDTAKRVADVNQLKQAVASQQAQQNQANHGNQYTQQSSSGQPFYSGVGGGVGVQSNVNYRDMAQQEYDVVYNAQVNALKNRITSLMAGMEGQKQGINMNYDGAVTNQNRQNTMSQNNYSNETNSRGLGRSSIATTGLGAMDVINNREVAGIDSRRTNDLNMVDAQKMALEGEQANTLGQMEADRANAIAVLARQLEDRDFGKQMQQSELSMRQAEINNRIKQMNYEHEQAQKQQGNGFSQFEFDTYNQYTAKVDDIVNNSKLTSKQKQDELDRLKQSFSSNYIIQQDMRPEMRNSINGMFNAPVPTTQSGGINSTINKWLDPLRDKIMKSWTESPEEQNRRMQEERDLRQFRLF